MKKSVGFILLFFISFWGFGQENQNKPAQDSIFNVKSSVSIIFEVLYI